MTKQSAVGNETRGTSIAGIERATGREWASWVATFEANNARELPHPAIAKLALAELPEDMQSRHWWSQGIAIAYEQQVGLRVPGQSSTGTFGVSATRTVPLDRDAAVAAWVAAYGDRAEHLGHAAGAPRPSRTEKRTFWRVPLDGAGRLEVAAVAKDDGRATLTVSQGGLTDQDRIEEWRAHWKALLAAL